MMTLYAQLATQWHKSIPEVQALEKQINDAFVMDIQKMSSDGKWHGILWQYDLHHRPFIAVSVNQGFDCASDAAKDFNAHIDQFRLPPLKAKVLEWPEDIYKLVKKLNPKQFERYPIARHKTTPSVVKQQKTYA